MKILILFSVLLIFEVFSDNVENVTSSSETTTTYSTQITESVTLEDNEDVMEDLNSTKINTLDTISNKPMLRSNEHVTDPFERLLDDTRLLKKNIRVFNSSIIDEILKSTQFLKGWNQFKKLNNKKYESKQVENSRKKIFLSNIDLIEEHNTKYVAGLVTYNMGVNEYTDMLHEEFIKKMTGVEKNINVIMSGIKASDFPITRFVPPTSAKIPDKYDWRRVGAVTAVKNQGSCGSCWAFSATGSLEGQLFRKKKRLVSLSEQNILDCSKSYGNDGCEGGVMASAFKYIHDNKGINSGKVYPYKGKVNTCRYKKFRKAATVSRMMEIEPGNEEHLKIAVATAGPVSVAIDANPSSFQFYRSGVLNEPTCSRYQLNHAVLVVGYGTDAVGGDFWIVKNSWGANWGSNGYIRMARNKESQCGIAQIASYPLL